MGSSGWFTTTRSCSAPPCPPRTATSLLNMDHCFEDRAREPVTRVAARPTLPRSLLVTHHPSAHHRARDQGDHHYNRSSKECAHLNGKKKGLTQCTSTETQTLALQLAPPLFQAQPTTGCDDKEEMIIV